MISFPKSPNSYSAPEWNQTNNSDINGSLFASFSLDLSENEGKLRIGRRLVANTLTSDSANLTSYPVGFKYFPQSSANANIWTVAGGRVFHQAEGYPNGSGFIQDATTSTPTICDSTLSDIEVFNNAGTSELYVTTNTGTVYYLTSSASSWATVASFGGGSSPTSLCAFGNTLYSGFSSTIISITAGGHTVNSSGSFTATIPDANQIITFIRASSTTLWIGTVNVNGGKGYMYSWDGVSTTITQSYRLKASGALSCVIVDDVPYITDSNGNLLAFNGGTFELLTGLYRRNKKMLFNAIGLNNSRFIHPNGMSLINNKINLLIDGRNYDNSTASLSSIDTTIPSGIYEYDENRGLTHKHSIAVAHSGDTITDYGAVKIAGAGALSEWNVPSNVAGRNGTLLCGASYYQDATTVKAGIFYDDSNDTLQKAGYLITSKIPAQDAKGFPSVQNTWQNIYTIYKKLLDSADKIVVKYRVYEQDPVETTITWVDSTSFTTTTDVTSYWTSGTGGEVEVLNGIGAGKCSHITSIVNNSGTYTVTVDETYTSASGTARARFQTWRKTDAITQNNSITAGVTSSQAGMGEKTNWVQFKIWCLFTGKDEIEKLLIINQDTNPAN